MLTKAELKYYSSLLIKKYRTEEKKFLVEGSKLIAEAIEYGFECEIVIYTPSFEEENRENKPEFLPKVKRIECVRNLDFQKLADVKTPQEIIGVFLEKNPLIQPEKSGIIVALENINDPGNLGSIIRNCDWFGIQSLILSPNCAELFNPKVIRASAGSVFHLLFNRVENFCYELNAKKKDGYKIFCADLDGDNIYQKKWEDKIVLVMANEANGPTEELISIVDLSITIPRIGNAESLNVSNACAVILSEATKH